jgi:hypothetical protein
MLQKRIERAPNNAYSANFDIYDDADFVDGTVKQVFHLGLGCVLIRRDVLEKIKFRYVPGVEVFPDSYFAEDCYRNKINIWAHTGLICEHRNQDWQVDVYSKNNKWQGTGLDLIDRIS